MEYSLPNKGYKQNFTTRMKQYNFLWVLLCIMCLLYTSCEKDIPFSQPELTKKYECHYKSLGEKLPNGEDAATIYITNINTGLNKEHVIISFGNKLRTPNFNFDLKDIFIYQHNDSANIYKDIDANRIFGHLTDNIQPIRFRVIHNADGDFAHSQQTFFTGGFHGYANQTDNNAIATAYEQSKQVYVDGKPINLNDKIMGSSITIKTTNLLQASNTEKHDGTGRYALKEEIIINYRNDTAFVQVNYTPLEDIIVYQVNGLAFFNDLEHIRFIGSQTKAGIYPNNILLRADRNVTAIQQFNNAYRFEVFIDNRYGIGNLEYNKENFNAQISSAQKSYFLLIDNLDYLPLKFLQGEVFSFRGGYTFKRNQ